jgi:hypothetical protein
VIHRAYAGCSFVESSRCGKGQSHAPRFLSLAGQAAGSVRRGAPRRLLDRRACTLAGSHLRRLGCHRLQELPPEERQELRQFYAVPILDVFGLWLQEEAPRVLPMSPMGEAVTYAQLQ